MKPISSQKINTWSVRMVESTLQRYTANDFQWHYEHGLQVMAIQKAGEATGEERYLKFAADWIDTFIQLDGTTYRLLAITPSQLIQSYDGAFRGTIGSFARLTDPRALAVTPMRVRLVTLPRAMTLAQFYSQYPSTVPIEQIALINGMAASETIPSGTMVKRVMAN